MVERKQPNLDGLKSTASTLQLTFSWSLHLQLSAGQPQAVQADDSLLPPGGGRPVWGGSRAERGSRCWLVASAPNTGPSLSW